MAISLKKNSSVLEKDECYLFKNYFGMDKNSTGWISYIKTEKKFNIKLRKHYKKMLVYHEIVCWDECEKDFDCEAISIKNVIGLQDFFFVLTCRPS